MGVQKKTPKVKTAKETKPTRRLYFLPKPRSNPSDPVYLQLTEPLLTWFLDGKDYESALKTAAEILSQNNEYEPQCSRLMQLAIWTKQTRAEKEQMVMQLVARRRELEDKSRAINVLTMELQYKNKDLDTLIRLCCIKFKRPHLKRVVYSIKRVFNEIYEDWLRSSQAYRRQSLNPLYSERSAATGSMKFSLQTTAAHAKEDQASLEKFHRRACLPSSRSTSSTADSPGKRFCLCKPSSTCIDLGTFLLENVTNMIDIKWEEDRMAVVKFIVR
ncbi:hypothetical protein BGX29_008368 [Mortierella sp. GBA35]|nr:hypothetical protein BGX29_008368 [Mortierella sp. GBA35]